MLRVLKFLDFQPRMGIITRALAVAAPELYSFFLLLAVIFIIYSLQAHLVFGHSLDTYRSMATSMNTNFQLLISNTDVGTPISYPTSTLPVVVILAPPLLLLSGSLCLKHRLILM
eukprot:jgi/Mesen1/2521/ME000160S01633